MENFARTTRKARLALPFRALTALDQEQESGSARSEAGGGGRLGQRAVAMKKYRINAHPAPRLQKNCARVCGIAMGQMVAGRYCIANEIEGRQETSTGRPRTVGEARGFSPGFSPLRIRPT